MGKGNVTYKEMIAKARDFADYFIDGVRTKVEGTDEYEYNTAFFMDNQERLMKVTDKVKKMITEFSAIQGPSDSVKHYLDQLTCISTDLNDCMLGYKDWLMSGNAKKEVDNIPVQTDEYYDKQNDYEEEGSKNQAVDLIAEALKKKTMPGREWMLTCDGESFLFAAQSEEEINEYIARAVASFKTEPKEVRLFKVSYSEVQLKETRSYRL